MMISMWYNSNPVAHRASAMENRNAVEYDLESTPPPVPFATMLKGLMMRQKLGVIQNSKVTVISEIVEQNRKEVEEDFDKKLQEAIKLCNRDIDTSDRDRQLCNAIKVHLEE